MGKVTILIVVLVFALSVVTGHSGSKNWIATQPRASDQALAGQTSPISLTIATVAPLLGPPTARYKVGEQVLVTISMANRSGLPGYACISSDLYQDLPTLTKNGQLLQYTKWQSSLVRNAQKDRTCEKDDLPDKLVLKANESTLVDFLVIVDDSQLPIGAQSWYDPLTPGAYELTIQRRLDCCDGPMIQSNKINFEVVP